jgi:HAD superfamily hydrolase (TIGR01509 family)
MNRPEPFPPDGILAILFDINGTLRRRVPDAAFQTQARDRLAALLGEADLDQERIDELNRRYKAYTTWADEQGVNLPEAEFWRRWILPERTDETLAARAAEQTMALRDSRGRTVLKPDAVRMIGALRRRGYRLGVISNSPSTLDIPRFLQETGLQDEFDVILLSSQFGVRKPDPSIFLEAARRMRVGPGQCAYIGNKPSCDVAGPRRAGFARTVLVDAKQDDPEFQPDRSLASLGELLEVFPPRN